MTNALKAIGVWFVLAILAIAAGHAVMQWKAS
jgi:hypothetical protein